MILTEKAALYKPLTKAEIERATLRPEKYASLGTYIDAIPKDNNQLRWMLITRLITQLALLYQNSSDKDRMKILEVLKHEELHKRRDLFISKLPTAYKMNLVKNIDQKSSDRTTLIRAMPTLRTKLQKVAEEYLSQKAFSFVIMYKVSKFDKTLVAEILDTIEFDEIDKFGHTLVVSALDTSIKEEGVEVEYAISLKGASLF